MKNYLAVFLLVFVPILLMAQSRSTFEISTSSPENPTIGGFLFEENAGGYDLISEARFGIDSAHIGMVNLDSGFAINAHTALTLPGRLQLNHVAAITDGYVISGFQDQSVVDLPFLVKVDKSFNLKWAKTFLNLDNSQRQIRLAISSGSDLSCYSYSSPANDLVYRMDTDLDATSFSSNTISHTNWDFRFYRAIQSGVQGTHILGGTTEEVTTKESDGLLVFWGTTGIDFARRYDFGSSISEQSSGLIKLADGNLIATFASFNASNNLMETYLCKLMPTGEIMWVKKLSLPSGLVIIGIERENSAGELFLSGSSSNPQMPRPTLVKLNAMGEVIWTRYWVPPNVGFGEVSLALEKSSGDMILKGSQQKLFIIETDSDAVACSFIPGPSILSENFTQYSVDTMQFTFSNFVVDTFRLNMVPTSLDYTSQKLCDTTTVSIEDSRDAISLTLYPQPAHDFLFIESSILDPNATISIYNSSGQLERQSPFQHKIDIQGWQRGWKMIRVSDGERSASRVVWVQ